jgi:hypothetical protein
LSYHRKLHDRTIRYAAAFEKKRIEVFSFYGDYVFPLRDLDNRYSCYKIFAKISQKKIKPIRPDDTGEAQYRVSFCMEDTQWTTALPVNLRDLPFIL